MKKFSGPHIGTWKMHSMTMTDVETKEKILLYGEHPNGYVGYNEEGRMYVLIVADKRKRPKNYPPNDAESVELFNSMTAYAGTYSIDGNHITHHIDLAWNQLWDGQGMVRQFKIEGDTLTLSVTMASSSDTAKSRSYYHELVWKKLS
jgi:lipocalin-like protein